MSKKKVLLGAFVLIVTIISAPLLYSKWRSSFTIISLRSPTAQPDGSLPSEHIPKPSSSALEGGLPSISGRASTFPFALLRLFPKSTIHALPLASDLSINVHSSSGSLDIETSTGIALGGESVTTRSEFSVRNLRRLRRQGWLVHLSSRELVSLVQRPFLSPTLTSSVMVLSDIGNTHRDTASDNVQYIFSPQIIERSAGGVHSDTPVLYPISPYLNSPIPLLALTSATVKNSPELECVDYNSVVHIGSPLGPSFLDFTLPGVLACSEEGSACEVNNVHGGESETRRLGDGNSDSLSEFLDKFPPPPPVDSIMNSSCDTLTSIIEKVPLALTSPVHTHNITMRHEEEQTAEHDTVDYLQESVEYRPEYHNERIKSSQSETIIRSFSVRDHLHHSLSMPFGMGSTECRARGLGFLAYNYVNPVKG